MLRLAFVTGTEPGKWFARYRDTTEHGLEEIPADDPFAMLISGSADLALLRLPDPRVGVPGERFHQVRLYSEKPGVAVPKDSVYAELYARSGEAVRLSELADEHVNYRYSSADSPSSGTVNVAVSAGGDGGEHGGPDGGKHGGPDRSEHGGPDRSEHGGPGGVSAAGDSIDELRVALQVVAANVGVAFAPAPLLKVLSKKQVVVLEVLDDETGAQGAQEAGTAGTGPSDTAEAGAGGTGPSDTAEAGADDSGLAETHIALVWDVEKDSDAIQDFVGVAKGRTRNSSRGGGVSRGKEVSAGRGTSRSERASGKGKRKVKGKTSAQRKGFRSKHPQTGVRNNRR